VRARFYDGVTARPHEVEVTLSDREIAFEAAGVGHAWPRAGLQAEAIGGLVRLSRPGDPARLQVARKDWPVDRPAERGFGALIPRAERRLVIGLCLAGLAVLAFVFVGMPAASGPLARMTPPAFEAQIGANFEDQIGLAFKSCTGKRGQAALQGLGERLGDADDAPFPIRVRAVQAPFANAFALPGGAVVVTDDLIEMAKTPDELSAVIAHEVAHVERRHVMQAVYRSLGLGLVLDAVVGGGTGAGQQAVLLAGSFTDLRYSRDAEREADARGMALLHEHGLSSQGMAPFFERLAAKGDGEDAAAVKELVSSHPDSLRRARLARSQARPGAPALDQEAWAAVKAACPQDGRDLRKKISDALSKSR
jgi:Zn-dependent protease with chaperone function